MASADFGVPLALIAVAATWKCVHSNADGHTRLIKCTLFDEGIGKIGSNLHEEA